MIKKAGILEMIPFKETIEDIGGLANLKEWLQRKAKVFSNMDQAKAFGVDMPKGVLIAGVPGCGKSLSAKATARLFNVPLLRLDMGRLLGKYVGESEANMRRAIELAEAISPCVLWIDELEKAFACQRQFEIVRKRRRNFVVFRRREGNKNQVLSCSKRVLTICCFCLINSLRSFRR